MTRVLSLGLLAVIVGFAAIQVVPFGRNHTNPPVRAEPQWDNPHTRQLAVAACFDCHSNQTNWAWYSNVAPMSWLIQRDVEEGREELNFSEWGPAAVEEVEDVGESVREGKMPPRAYLVMHSEANLSSVDRVSLVDGLERSLRAR